MSPWSLKDKNLSFFFFLKSLPSPSLSAFLAPQAFHFPDSPSLIFVCKKATKRLAARSIFKQLFFLSDEIEFGERKGEERFHLTV